jgi:hypothetical protein
VILYGTRGTRCRGSPGRRTVVPAGVSGPEFQLEIAAQSSSRIFVELDQSGYCAEKKRMKTQARRGGPRSLLHLSVSSSLLQKNPTCTQGSAPPGGPVNHSPHQIVGTRRDARGDVSRRAGTRSTLYYDGGNYHAPPQVPVLDLVALARDSVALARSEYIRSALLRLYTT